MAAHVWGATGGAGAPRDAGGAAGAGAAGVAVVGAAARPSRRAHPEIHTRAAERGAVGR